MQILTFFLSPNILRMSENIPWEDTYDMAKLMYLVYGYMKNWKINNKSHTEELKPGDSVYIKPNVPHNFRNKGKLMVLRIAGRIAGDAQRELSSLDKNDAHRAISEVSMWFDPLEKTNS